MSFPQLKYLANELEYEKYYMKKYCRKPIITFDNIPVHFHQRDFKHIFFESINSRDDTFSFVRAERIDWIEYALRDKNADLRAGWLRKKKAYSLRRRVAIISGDYVVVIQLNNKLTSANIVTAYVADKSIGKILSAPKWQKK
ncbi:MAG: hypothetical protein K9N06_11505 [Candidatus Cloacimonetes bacterium]|nr:hypothetical protein [Candidatus Cloacimonadota bacterium]